MQAVFIPYSLSSYLSVTTQECASCATHYYDRTKSKSAVFPDETPANLVNRTIGPVYYEEGYMGTDTVCFARSDKTDLCADDVEFMAVTVFDGWT